MIEPKFFTIPDFLKKQKSEKINCVYFVSDPDFKFVKIGVARSGLKHRLNSIQTDFPLPFFLLHFIQYEFPEEAERSLHAIYKKYHHFREWFYLKTEILQDIILSMRGFVIWDFEKKEKVKTINPYKPKIKVKKLKELEKEYLNVKETGEYLHLSDSTVRRHIRTGYFPSVKVGRRVLIPKKELDRVIKEKRDV